jgi:predicted dithiol-disulfide oxidoreductase (DUF899 family)
MLTSGRWDEVAEYIAFMSYPQPWSSVRGVENRILTDEGHVTCYLRAGDRTFRTYAPTGRGNEPADGSLGLLDLTPYGRGEDWQDHPHGWPAGSHACWYWRTDDVGEFSWGSTSRPMPQWTRPGVTPGETLGRHDGDH